MPRAERESQPIEGMAITWNGELVTVAGDDHGRAVLYFLLMAAAIVGADILFPRDHLTARLITNICIVAVVVTAYMLFFRKLMT